MQVQRRRGIVMKNGIENGCGGIAGERHATSGHLVQHCAEAKEIRARIQTLPLRLFR